MSTSSENSALTTEKQTLLALRALRRRVEELEQRRRKPIAIVGMACRIPGGINNPDDFWRLLAEKRSAIREIPQERIDLTSLFDAEPRKPGRTYSKWAGLVDHPGDFDAEFFGISPREALSADPQQRMLLETSWEALEDAGIDPKTLVGSDAGVFVGVTMTEYAQHYQSCVPVEGLAAHCIQGAALNAANGRLSYFYGLQGPSMAIDTACSSSLVAIDRACRSLVDRETSLTIAGGVHVLATPANLIMMSQWGMLSPEGECRAFDERADGFVRAEGCGLLILKRLRDAEADGDRILGVIRGSAVNQDGASSGLTVPNGMAQQELLRKALRSAGIEPWQVGYIEAHGTGTALGDPLEAQALGAVFSKGKKREWPLLFGSVKTNIGHLESAAGVAGLIKVLLALQHGQIPAQLHGKNRTKQVPWQSLPLAIATETTAWNPIEGRRIAGVSSFGFSGTNAHVLVEGVEDKRSGEARVRPVEVLPLSARTPEALRALAKQYADFLDRSTAGWGEICYSAGAGRAALQERLAMVAPDATTAAAALREWLREEAAGGTQSSAVRRSRVFRGRVRPGERVRLALALGAESAGGDGIGDEGYRAWEAKWRSWGVDPVVITTGAAAEAWAKAGVNLVLEMGTRTETAGSLPVVHLRDAEWANLAEAMAELFVRGVRVDWKGWQDGLPQRKVALPTYPFQRERFWITPQDGRMEKSGRETGRPLLGRQLRVAGVAGQFETELAAAGRTSWLGDHVVEGRAVFPGTGHLELMLEAGAEVLDGVAVALEDVIFQSQLIVDTQRRMQTVVENPVAGRSRVQVYAETGGEKWEAVSEGWICVAGQEEVERLDLNAIQSRLARKERADHYALAAERGLYFGPAFQGVTELWIGEGEALAAVHTTADESGHIIAPWRLDACLQAAGAMTGEGLYLPLSVAQFRVLSASGESCWSHVTVQSTDATTVHATVTVADAEGTVLARIENLRLKRRAENTAQSAIYDVAWLPADLASDSAALRGSWLLAGDDAELVNELAQEVRAQGGNAIVALDLQAAKAAVRQNPSGVIYACATQALRKDAAEVIDEMHGYGETLQLLQTLVREQVLPKQGVWLITRNGEMVHGTDAVAPEARAIAALRRTAAVEFGELRVHWLDLDSAGNGETAKRVIAGTAEPEIAWRNGTAWKPRLVEQMVEQTEVEAETENIELRPAKSGVLDDVVSAVVPRTAPGPEEIEIEVRAHGVNFRDVMNALGMLPGYPQVLGAECAGLIVRAGERSGFKVGERVFAFAPGSFRTFVTMSARNAARIPAQFRYEEAAALPVVYLTALLGFDRFARLKPGERVLIHSGAGGLGLAAIAVAKARGAVVLATAGSEEKRAYLRQLGVEHVFPSRTVDFAKGVMEATGGRGVDVVLNSLTGALAEATLQVLSPHGRFLEVGKRDVLTKDEVAQARPDVQHFQYDLSEEAERDTDLAPALMKTLLDMLAVGTVKLLPVTEFAKAADAFRYMAQARHTGKIVIPRAGKAFEVDAYGTYLITGGTGALGLHVASWLVRRGARYVILLSRSGGGAAATKVMGELAAQGADVQLASVDVADADALSALLHSIPSERPLRGVVHAAGVLDDRSLLRQDFDAFLNVARPKWGGAWNLHRLTLEMPLHFFVLFSSVSALIGKPGQANYSAANSLLDGLAFWRRSLGLPALSVAWGPWAGGGMAQEMAPSSFGFGWLRPEEATQALERLLAQNEATAAVMTVDSWKRFAALRPARASTLFADLVQESVPQTRADERRKSFASALLEAAPARRAEILAEHLQLQTAHILSLAAGGKLDEDTALHDLGLDSLMAVELRNRLQTSLERQLPATLVLDHPTLRALREVLLGEILEDEAKTQRTDAGESVIDEPGIEDMTDSQAEALLVAELERPVQARKY